MFISLKRALIATSTCSIFLTLAPLAAQAATTPVCVPMAGFVRLDPDATCKIATAYPGPIYLGQLGVPNSCFSVQLTSLLYSAKGSAGLTTETMVAPTGGVIQTPAMLNEAGITAVPNELGFTETRRLFTGRSVLSLPGGKIYTADAGVLNIGFGGSTEQLIITGGDGTYANAKGYFYASGKIISSWGGYTGQVCY